MNDPAILFMKPKAITSSDKKTLRSAGILIVEVDDVNDVKFIRAHSELSGTDLLVAAAKCISETDYDSVRSTFAKAICAAIMAKEIAP